MSGPAQKDEGPLPPFRSWRPGKLTKPDYPLRRVILLILLVVVVLAALIGTVIILTSRRDEPAPSPATARTQDSDTAGMSTSCFTVQPGEVMTRLLNRASIDDSAAVEVISALRSADFNFRRMKPGDSLQLEYREGRLYRILYRKGNERVYCIDFSGGVGSAR